MSLKSWKRNTLFVGLSLALFSQFAMAVSITPTLANGMVGRAYSITNLATLGVAPYSVSATNIPFGMSVSGDGFLSGTPTTAGTYNMSVFATDATNASVTSNVSITILPEPIISGAGIITSVGANYMVVNGGLIPTNVNVYYPTVFTGFTFLNGASLTVGKFITYTGTVDALGGVHASSVVVDIAPPIVTFVASLLNAKVGNSYTSTNLLATGVSPYSVSASGVPAGMTVSTGGLLSGVPTATGTYIIALSATDSVGTVGTGTVSITVDAADIITPSVCDRSDDDNYDNDGHEKNDKNNSKKNRSPNQYQKVEGDGKITAITADSITIKNLLIKIISDTQIELERGVSLVTGMKVEYQGVKNSDGSITACKIEQD